MILARRYGNDSAAASSHLDACSPASPFHSHLPGSCPRSERQERCSLSNATASCCVDTPWIGVSPPGIGLSVALKPRLGRVFTLTVFHP